MPIHGKLLCFAARCDIPLRISPDDPPRDAADNVASAITNAGKGGKVVRLRGDA